VTHCAQTAAVRATGQRMPASPGRAASRI
jgi:hypothetical protein